MTCIHMEAQPQATTNGMTTAPQPGLNQTQQTPSRLDDYERIRQRMDNLRKHHNDSVEIHQQTQPKINKQIHEETLKYLKSGRINGTKTKSTKPRAPKRQRTATANANNNNNPAVDLAQTTSPIVVSSTTKGVPPQPQPQLQPTSPQGLVQQQGHMQQITLYPPRMQQQQQQHQPQLSMHMPQQHLQHQLQPQPQSMPQQPHQHQQQHFKYQATTTNGMYHHQPPPPQQQQQTMHNQHQYHQASQQQMYQPQQQQQQQHQQQQQQQMQSSSYMQPQQVEQGHYVAQHPQQSQHFAQQHPNYQNGNHHPHQHPQMHPHQPGGHINQGPFSSLPNDLDLNLQAGLECDIDSLIKHEMSVEGQLDFNHDLLLRLDNHYQPHHHHQH